MKLVGHAIACRRWVKEKSSSDDNFFWFPCNNNEIDPSISPSVARSPFITIAVWTRFFPLESNCISSTSRCYLRFNVTMLISHQPSVCVAASKSKSKLRALRRVTCSLEQQINSLPFSSLFSSSLLFPSSFALCAGQLEYEKNWSINLPI